MTEEKKSGKVLVIRVRGQVDVRKTIKYTLVLLHLNKPNWATVLDVTDPNMGMIQKAKDFITWGEIDEKTFTDLVTKWGRKAGDKRLESKEAQEFSKDFFAGKTTFKEAGIKPNFRLHPPTKGQPRVGIKKHVNIGGALGYRGNDINVLVAKMAGLKDGTQK